MATQRVPGYHGTTDWTEAGTVSRTNDHGLQLAEHGDRWFNPSKFCNPMPSIPPVGVRVLLTLDKSGYIRGISPASTSEPMPEPTPISQAAVTTTEQDALSIDERQLLIIRQCALKAACDLAGTTSADIDTVLAIAARFEAWVTR